MEFWFFKSVTDVAVDAAIKNQQDPEKNRLPECIKNYIEIRNHDCQKIEYALAIPAIYKGIMYADNGMKKINDL